MIVVQLLRPYSCQILNQDSQSDLGECNMAFYENERGTLWMCYRFCNLPYATPLRE